MPLSPRHLTVPPRWALLLLLCAAGRPVSAQGAPLLNWTLEGNAVNQHAGEYLSTAGDVNNDGYSDVLVGLPNFADGQAGEGQAQLFLGGPAGLAATPAWTVESNVVGNNFGRCVAPAGDINNDGCDDWLVGSTGYDNGQTNEGAVYVFMGSVGALSPTPAVILESNVGSCLFGHSAGTAGDVNGDGFMDVIVGAYTLTNGQNQEGKAFVYLGSAAGLSATPAWSYESDQIAANLGFSVSTAGDVNGDGFADVVVGAYRYDNTLTDEGRIFVFHGSGAGLSLAPSFGYSLGLGSAFGYSVATAGDVDGDGYSDVVVGLRSLTSGQSNEGGTMILRGGAGGLGGTPPLLESNLAGAFMGTSVAPAGDMNGDGFPEVVVGAPGYNGNGIVGGGAFVTYGGGIAPSGLGTMADTLSGGAIGEECGTTVATAGDVNGDGFGDLLVGSRSFANGQAGEGRVQLFLGGATLPRVGPTVSLPANGEAARIQVAPAGDFNGDGMADFLVSDSGFPGPAPGGGSAVLFYGSSTGPGAGQEVLHGLITDEAVGSAISGLFDVNGDGLSDIIVGSPGWKAGALTLGRVTIHHGNAVDDTTPDGEIPGSQAGASFGQSAALVGDVNADGFADLLVGAPSYENGLSVPDAPEGRVDLYLGSAAGIDNISDWHLEGDAENLVIGLKVAWAGDVNGDGFSDVAIVLGHVSTGAVLDVVIFEGHPGPQYLVQAAVLHGTSSSFARESMGSAGDFNGDGLSDFLVGAPLENRVGATGGRAYGYFGSATGLSETAGWIVDTPPGYLNFAASLTTAGDLNADGYSDVLVSGGTTSPGAVLEEGPLYVFHGGPAGPALTPTWTSPHRIGNSVHHSGGVGDLNGDGLADFCAITLTSPARSVALETFSGSGERFGRRRRPQVTQSGSFDPVAAQGIPNNPTTMALSSFLISPLGRERVAQEFQVRPFRLPFTGGIASSHFFALPAPVAPDGSTFHARSAQGALTPGTAYHSRHRQRMKSPYFARSIWLSNPFFGGEEMEFRMGGAVAAAPEGTAPVRQRLLGAPTPNPAQAGTAFELSLPGAGWIQLELFDVQGRAVRRLVDDLQTAGPRTIRWDGRDDDGRPVSAGIYFARLTSPFGKDARRVSVIR